MQKLQAALSNAEHDPSAFSRQAASFSAAAVWNFSGEGRDLRREPGAG